MCLCRYVCVSFCFRQVWVAKLYMSEIMVLEMCSGLELSFVANSGFFALVFQQLISVSHFLFWCLIPFCSVPLTMWLETDGLKWLGPQTPEHQPCFSSTCYPFISCFSQPQILPFYSSAIWQSSYIPFHSITTGIRLGANQKWQLPWLTDQLPGDHGPETRGMMCS